MSSDEERARSAQQLKELLGKISEENKGSPEEGEFDYGRFGLAWLILAVLTAVIGVYPFPVDAASRAMFLCFSVVLAFIGGYYVDRANRDRKKKRDGRPSDDDPPQRGPSIRRIK